MIQRAILLAGYPDRYPTVYHRTRFLCGDMTVFFDDGEGYTAMIVRNIELPRAKASGRAKEVFTPEDLKPAGGLSGDRNTAFGQAAAELLRRRGVHEVTGDSMLPLYFADLLGQAGVKVHCDFDLGKRERRSKDAWEVEQLRACQKVTEEAIRFAYDTVRDAAVRDGVLFVCGEPLTSERLRGEIAVFVMKHGYQTPGDSIVAGGPVGGDCHHRGAGPLRVDEPIILDVFPQDVKTRYWGDCTRTIVRGTPHPKIVEMHAAVEEAKRAAIAACRASGTGADVHRATLGVFQARGYHIGNPPEGAPRDLIFCPHGTGHGVGLEGHEEPILDLLGGPLVEGDCLTIEPGLYCHALGGVRVEDMVIVRKDGAENLNRLPEGLWWV